ncbi:hypothetical protein BASA50_004512 [Batrachochytrium salamandrivorans]|uniref:Uncharacterized protein n=1 Tax=Batrachochytrium salamandrivorans TaxID=1357716 RepID=A0ABQ8FFE1_9FUNG|nr:hypothetical protein BASA60_010576 [Batrachochytrium salamandrivorans]KAH6593017.1 hypothetical protein BASA61_004404 [Batrachochytrium salamandrivorans]KAH6597370.1 hypothetical protein BASA50_004512 [Batrachochytrium salamandrivorans]KAH9247175.1 hypothetical protein BASA81_015232 [Batrachochytrium salamandrivorans]KAH9266215.1 hypothetical protein BASA84_001259 [Batrachochytrium salamandrivorans]
MSSNSPTTVEPANNIGDMDGSNEAESVQCPVFWTTDYDMKKRTWGDWMAAHTSFMYPLHHYIGTATLQGDRLTLSGHHKSERNMRKGTATNASLVGGVAEEKTTSPVTVVVHRLRAKSVTQGFDSIFRRIDDRGVGLYMPVILVYDDQDDSSVISANSEQQQQEHALPLQQQQAEMPDTDNTVPATQAIQTRTLYLGFRVTRLRGSDNAEWTKRIAGWISSTNNVVV